MSQSECLPNILLILADDLGYGDVSCYNPESKVATPNIDKLATDGMRFTDAHSPSTVCTPSRYSILTGRMAFRTGFCGVFTGAGGPCLIEDSRLTLPAMLKTKGYKTALFGKWHVGLSFLDRSGAPINENGFEPIRKIDYTRSIPDAPIHRGFDHFFGTACCPTTDFLYAFIDGDRVPVPPVALLDKATLPNHPYSIDNRIGLIAPDFDLEEVDMVFLDKSKAFLENHAQESPDDPFFLFHSTQAVHLPSFAQKGFQGKTNVGPHGDFIFQFDYLVGELLHTLQKLDMVENTLVIVCSDNGPEVTSVVNMRADYQHDGARPWRGMKRDQWEGGHRIPFIARWPSKVPAGVTNDQTVSLCDIMATCASVVNFPLPDDVAEDSFNIYPIIGKKELSVPTRTYTLHQTISLALSIRRDQWKYLDHQGSGGNDYESLVLQPYVLKESQPTAPAQLYNLDEDPGETTNLYFDYPEIVEELKIQLELAVNSGRTRFYH